MMNINTSVWHLMNSILMLIYLYIAHYTFLLFALSICFFIILWANNPNKIIAQSPNNSDLWLHIYSLAPELNHVDSYGLWFSSLQPTNSMKNVNNTVKLIISLIFNFIFLLFIIKLLSEVELWTPFLKSNQFVIIIIFL